MFQDSVDIIVTGEGGEFKQVVAASDAEGHSGAFVEPSADSASATDYSPFNGIQVVSTFPANTKAAKAEADGAKAAKSASKSSKSGGEETSSTTSTTASCIPLGEPCLVNPNGCCKGGCCVPLGDVCCFEG